MNNNISRCSLYRRDNSILAFRCEKWPYYDTSEKLMTAQDSLFVAAVDAVCKLQ